MTTYATLAEFRAYLKTAGGPVAPTAEDGLLQTFLEEASAVLRDYVGQPLAATSTTTRRFDAGIMSSDGEIRARDRLLLFDDYCVGISAVVNGDGTTVSASEYVTLPRNQSPIYGIQLKISSSQVWTWDTSPESAIQVTAYWAWTTNADGSADDLTRGATLQLAAWLYRSKDQVAELSRPISTGDGVTILPMALPAAVLDRLAGRRRML